MQILEVIKVKNQLKVQPFNRPGTYVRFPRKLRKVGKLFKVDGLKFQGSFYTVVGTIEELVIKHPTTKKKSTIPRKKFYVIVEYPGHSKSVDDTVRKIAKKNKFKEDGSGYCFMDGQRDIGFTYKGNEKDFNKKFKSFKKQVANQAPKNGNLAKKEIQVSFQEAI